MIMADKMTVRMYNVRFGDAILVTIPDHDPKSNRTTIRRILIDVGNAPKAAGTGAGGEDTVFKPVIEDLLDTLGNKALDLYIMTHEHLDHVQGLFYASTKLPELNLLNRLKVNFVWLTASANPNYYDGDKHPEAKKKKLEFDAMCKRLTNFFLIQPALAPKGFMEILNNNNPSNTGPCVEFIRNLNPQKTTYIYRGIELENTHPFKEAKFSIWAPEEDTSDYYGSFQSFDTGVLPYSVDPNSTNEAAIQPSAPPGVDMGAFLKLLESRRSGFGDNLLTIDKAANNTSIVFALEWRGWRLLFPGDAEERSWKTMERENVLDAVHFLKVSHHGSHNGTPSDDIFDKILPENSPDGRIRRAAISTWRDTYSGIPHDPTNERLRSRTTLFSTLDDTNKLYYDIDFTG